ncbi:MAG TPA: hypothetical protein VHN77_06265 [Phycisphaerales bacterium]|nr:hypothetical protein [Phycisphaerales bacterium]
MKPSLLAALTLGFTAALTAQSDPATQGSNLARVLGLDADSAKDAQSGDEPVVQQATMLSAGAEPRAVLTLPRSKGGPWRFLVSCDETSLDQSDITAPENGWRRITHAVLLVETRPEWHDEAGSTYALFIEQMAMDTVRGPLDALASLPTTDPSRPIPAREGSALYTRSIPRVIGTRGEYRTRTDGSLASCQFKMDEEADMEAMIGVATVARFIMNFGQTAPSMPMGAGARWTVGTNDEVDAHPVVIARTMTLDAAPTPTSGPTISQAFTDTVERPDRAPAMFAGVDGTPRTFGSQLSATCTASWGLECPIPTSAVLSWTEHCTGTFTTAGDAPRELTGKSAARRTNTLRFVTFAPALFVEEGTEEVRDAANEAIASGEEPEETPEQTNVTEEPLLTTDLDKAGQFLDTVLTIHRLAKPKPQEGKGPARSWSRTIPAKSEQRIEVRVRTRSMGSDVLGITEETSEHDTRAIVKLVLNDEMNEDDFPKGVITFEALEHTQTDKDSSAGERFSLVTNHDRAWVFGLSIPFAVSSNGPIWIDPIPSSSDHLAGYLAVQNILSAIDDAAIDRPFDDFSLGASAIEETGSFGSEDEAASRSSIRDRSKDTGELVLHESDLYRNPKSSYLKIWGREIAPSIHADHMWYTLRHNTDGAGTILPEHMTLSSLSRVRSTYLKDEKEQTGELIKSTEAHITTVKGR